jgi:hypothetical protein
MSRAFDLLADLRPLATLPVLEIASAIHLGAFADVFQEATWISNLYFVNIFFTIVYRALEADIRLMAVETRL